MTNCGRKNIDDEDNECPNDGPGQDTDEGGKVQMDATCDGDLHLEDRERSCSDERGNRNLLRIGFVFRPQEKQCDPYDTESNDPPCHNPE